MSHTYKTRVEGTDPTTFVFNSDLSGSVTIVHDGQRIEVPGDNLLDFIHTVKERQGEPHDDG